jgi:hypothetical protein
MTEMVWVPIQVPAENLTLVSVRCADCGVRVLRGCKPPCQCAASHLGIAILADDAMPPGGWRLEPTA